MTSKLMSNMSRTFSNSGFSRTYSSAPKPFQFTKLHQANMSPLPTPSHHKPKKDRRGTCMAVCCCCFTGCISMLITAAIGLGIAALIIWLVLRPIHIPTYQLQDVTFSQFLYTPASHTLDATYAYTIVADNPNGKIGIQYDYINIDSSYMGHVLTPSTSIPGFYHGHRNVTKIPVKFATTGFELNAVEGEALKEQMTTGSNVTLVMHVDVRAQLKIGVVRTPSYTVHVICDVNIKPPVRVGAPATVACRKA
ncbi:hypothetical protein KC19_1G002000 [Ceratodon purpureus]|uniref:Late embryogenesis abundant protein LEA-2 subgroup domain-containing protein n=1 Tax=Ceratodon purpureus TaxID=3225 RepID=A0A8T0J361_CERPU|nr:hypothetical protein KC19_1G002000 [Ceratodon purpureus]